MTTDQHPGAAEPKRFTRLPAWSERSVRKDIVYRTTVAGPLTMMAIGLRTPTRVRPAFRRCPRRSGYNDVGFEKILGVTVQGDGAGGLGWGQLIAARGLVAIAYTNREPAA